MATDGAAGVKEHLGIPCVSKIVSFMNFWPWSSSWHLLEIVLTQFNENIKYMVSKSRLIYCCPLCIIPTLSQHSVISDSLEKSV